MLVGLVGAFGAVEPVNALRALSSRKALLAGLSGELYFSLTDKGHRLDVATKLEYDVLTNYARVIARMPRPHERAMRPASNRSAASRYVSTSVRCTTHDQHIRMTT